jgi:hypothetical protein
VKADSKSGIRNALICCAALVALAGCAWCRIRPPQMPAALQVPTAQRPFLEAHASGVQIYQCEPKSDAPGTFSWTFEAPEATLMDRHGHPIGRHYAGPTWELRDGSRVSGEIVARDPGPDPAAIPWLLLRARSASGSGPLNHTESIQRVRTVGGVAPTTACSEAQAHAQARVPYTATYIFYGAHG